MSALLIERGLAFVSSIVVGVTAAIQLRNELPVRGLDAAVTKLLLGLMAIGCVLAFLAALDVIGKHA
jgi:hypothetical protein